MTSTSQMESTAPEATRPATAATRPPRCAPLDTLRGIAVVAMLLNHAGIALLRPELVNEVSSLGGALTFFGSFAPVLFFFTTGFGYGWSDPGPPRPGERRDVLYKAAVLIAADVLLRGGSWLNFGWDFLGFIGFCIVAVHPLRRLRRGEAVALGVIAALLGLRYLAAPLAVHLAAEGPVRTLLSQALGQRPISGISYPITPWLVYPFAGFVVSRWARRFSPSKHPLAGARVWIASASLIALAWILASRGMYVGRWGTVSVTFFVASLGVMGACVALGFALERAGPARNLARRVAITGLSSLAFVPIHYTLIRVCASLTGEELASVRYTACVLLLLPVAFLLARLVGRVTERGAVALGDAGSLRRVGLALLVATGVVTTLLDIGLLRSSLCQLGMLFSVFLFAIKPIATVRSIDEATHSEARG